MKKKTIINFVGSTMVLSAIAICAAVGIGRFDGKVEQAKAYDSEKLTTTIDLNDSSAETIRSYYSALNSLSEDERKGDNLLKNLKEVLKKDQKYYPYDKDTTNKRIWKMYEIIDRDWTKSPASEIEGYDASTNKITNYKYGESETKPGSNPYIRALYVDRSVDNKMHAWVREGSGDLSHGNDKEWAIDREHIWPKSHGFETESAGGARGDPMHLWPGDSDVNSHPHNNNYYGYVDTSKKDEEGKHSYGKNNFSGISLTLGTTVKVFEPQDSDKGDIARAIFYMVARYNNLAGGDTINSDNPNLALTQSLSDWQKSGYDSTSSKTGKMGIMTDLLAWHHADPVDEYEIHRNNLLYTNYTNNRNPFIDFPQWVDYIWGTATYEGRTYKSYDSTPTGVAKPSTDEIALPSNPPAPSEPEKKGFDFAKNWWIFVVIGVVVIIVIVLICVGVVKIKVNKKGKVKVKVPGTTSKKSSSKKSSSGKKKK